MTYTNSKQYYKKSKQGKELENIASELLKKNKLALQRLEQYDRGEVEIDTSALEDKIKGLDE